MFRKKQKLENNHRNVRSQRKANVFSYYASRSASDDLRIRPKLQHTPKKRQIFDGRKWLSIAPSVLTGIVILSCLVYVSTLSGQVKLQIAVEHDKAITAAHMDIYKTDIQKAIFDNLIHNKSKFLINIDEVAYNIQNKFPEFGKVNVIVPLIDRQLIVQIDPAEPVLILGTHNGGLVVGESGRVISKASDIESSTKDKLPVLQDESNLFFELGSYALSEAGVAFVRDISDHVSSKGYKIKSMSLSQEANEIYLRLEGIPYYIKLDSTGKSRVQIGSFFATKEKLAKDGISPQEYIDLRVSGKVYYK